MNSIHKIHQSFPISRTHINKQNINLDNILGFITFYLLRSAFSINKLQRVKLAKIDKLFLSYR